ncbi:MAG: flavin reductase family protein [Saprospiraceae bacterium]
MVGTVGPRPIAFVSTLDAEGKANVAPYSFFNIFSSNPPIAVFSSNRRVRDNTTKDTLANIEATGECVINVVSHSIVRQMAVASVEWPHEVSEFDAAGFTPLASDTVKAFRVKESPAHLECKVKEVIPLGDQGGAGHLIICNVTRLHIDEEMIDESDRVDPFKLDLMGRMGRAFYVRASGDAVFPIVQPVLGPAIGFMGLPESIKNSSVLTGNDLGRLAGAKALPEASDVNSLQEEDGHVKEVLAKAENGAANHQEELHRYVQQTLEKNDVDYALKIAMFAAQM